ncbi:hypothetical protein [Salibacterium qingdaonense]|uniref:Uncharacterized protein n=1 Tax=Salibacterium qingdaonense TaxID=266892 RepID=A0A1I4K513_9BACI|nr:hypothetical protein [Salibacterium qingdaonense]SFL73888.1 hypothetical protein SAMN04488054_104118 [Salibacterium qingdaonense]
MKRGVFTAALLAVFLAACSAGGTQSEPELKHKELTGDEQRYLDMGLNYSEAYNVSGTFPEQIQAVELVMNVYRNGEKLDEASTSGFKYGLMNREEEELEEIVFGIDREQSREEEVTPLKLIIGDKKVKEKETVSQGMAQNIVNLPFVFDSTTYTNVKNIPIEAGGVSPLAIMRSGDQISNNWYKEEHRKRIINKDEKVVIFEARWLVE